MKRLGKLSEAFLPGGLIVLLILTFAGHAFSSGTPKFTYVTNSNSHTVSAYTINSATGALSPVSGSPFATGFGPLGVAVDPSGKFAYVANELSDNVSAYTINSTTGALSPVSGSPFATGLFPWGVAVDPSGKFAYVANSNSHNASAYTIDSTTGALSPVSGSPFATESFPVGVAVVGQSTVPFAAFAGTPGTPNCHGGSVSALIQQFGGLGTAASALGFLSVQALQDAIREFCEE